MIPDCRNNFKALPDGIFLWNTSLTFNFPDEVTTFRFLVLSGALIELSLNEYSGRTSGESFTTRQRCDYRTLFLG